MMFIKRYILNDNISKKELVEFGFKESKNKINYICQLTNDTTLNININIIDNFLIFHDEFDTSIIGHDSMNDIIIKNYNNKMDELKDKGIFKVKKKVLNGNRK